MRDFEHDRVLIEGVAGTGKTTLAVERVERWIEQGRGVVVLTATDPLARWWETRVPEALCRSVPSLCRTLIARTGVVLDEDDPEYWSQLVREGADSVLAAGDGWDAVLVDGASDLSDAAWVFAEACATRGVLWACLDPMRRFWPDRAVPRAVFDHTIVLSTVHRAPELFNVAQRYLAIEPEPGALPPNLQLSDRAPAELAQDLLDQGCAAETIAVLSLRGRRDHRCLVHHDRLGVSGSSRDADQRVIVDTFLRFSGLSRAVVILGDLDLVEDRMDDRMYLGLTRATERVIVCAPRAVFEHDEVLYDGLSTMR